MGQRFNLPVCVALLAAGASTAWSGIDAEPPPNFDVLKITMARISEAPLPFQAVRLRVVFQNKSQKRLGPATFENRFGFTLVKGPNEASYSGKQPVIYSTIIGATVASSREFMNRKAPLILEPGEQTSVSFAIGVLFPGSGQAAATKTDPPLFQEPGVYWIKQTYLVDPERGKEIAIELKIEVREPQGDDRAIYHVLQKNPQLAAALVSPLRIPDKTLVPKLKAIAELFPESSYTGYARFALARFYLKGLTWPGIRVDQARAADQLDRIDSRLGAFAYSPNVLLAMKAADPRSYQVNRLALRLADEYSDALEWLEEFAYLLHSPEGAVRREREEILNIAFPERPSGERAQVYVWGLYRKRVPALPKNLREN